jgi:hypothetical protein
MKNILKFLSLNVIFTIVCGIIIYLISGIEPVWVRVWLGSLLLSGVFFVLILKRNK